MKIFALPDLGEGLQEALILKWHVEEGDTVQLDHVIATMESAKAAVDIPASFTGKILKKFGNTGEIIKTGAPLVGFEGTSLLKIEEKQGIVGNISQSETGFFPLESKQIEKRKASLEARAYARKHGINLDTLGLEKSLITIEDLKKLIEKPINHSQNLSGNRLIMAHRMMASQKEVAPVTCGCDVKIQGWKEKKEISVRVLRAIGKACISVPIVNATYYFETKEYLLNQKVNVGMAFDTEEGTYLPVIKDVNSLTLAQMREEINTFKGKIKSKELTKDDCQKPTILFSNFGSLGVTHANPIIIPPMVAIIGVGKVFERLEFYEEAFQPIKYMPLFLTVNHILITGGEASRFLTVLIRDLEGDL